MDVGSLKNFVDMTAKQSHSNGWHFLIRYKDGSIPSVAEAYRSIRGYGGSDSLDGTIAREYPRKGKVNKNCIWNGLQPDAGNRRNAGKNRKTKMLAFQWPQ